MPTIFDTIIVDRGGL